MHHCSQVPSPGVYARLFSLSLLPSDASAPAQGPRTLQTSAALSSHRPPQVPSSASPELQAGHPRLCTPPVLTVAAPPGEDSL